MSNKNKQGSGFAGTFLLILLLIGALNSVFDNDEDNKEPTSKFKTEKESQEYDNIKMPEKYKQKFINACISCGIDANKINYTSKIENWSNGERYNFYYNDIMHTVYFIDSGEVNSINYGGNNDIKLYEYGYESLNINDFNISSEIYATLQVASENVVKGNLNFPDTADFDWFTKGFCKRYYNYYVIGCEFTAKNAFGIKQSHSFIIHATINENNSDFVYYELDGVAVSGEPNIPKIEKKPIGNLTENKNGMIKITEGILGEYGRKDNFDGEMYIRYYIPSGKYTVTCDTQKSTMYIESIVLHKEDGFDTATIIEKITFNDTKESRNIIIKDGECVSLTVNSIINLKPISQ